MRYVLVICRRCQRESKVQVLTEDEIRRDPQIPRGPILCPNCGNVGVEVRR